MALVQSADLIIANLSYATRVSIGTVQEIAWAVEAGKPVILILPSDDEIHSHPFLLDQAIEVVDNLVGALAEASIWAWRQRQCE